MTAAEMHAQLLLQAERAEQSAAAASSKEQREALLRKSEQTRLYAAAVAKAAGIGRAAA